MAQAAGDEIGDAGALPVDGIAHDGGGKGGVGPLEEFHDVGADQHPRDHGLGQGIAAQPVETVQVPAGRLAGREKPL